MKKTLIYNSAAVLGALLVWQIVSQCVNNSILIASPVSVFLRLLTIWKEDDFFSTVLCSLSHIALGYFYALVLGILLALLSYRVKIFEYILKPYIVCFKAVPVASFIIMCLIWLSFSQLTAFIAFLIAFPVIYSNLSEGLKSLDEKMLEMACIYKMPYKKRFKYIYLPGIKPFLISGVSVSMGMAWKAGVAAEVIGLVEGTIGEKLYNAKIYFQNADLIAWTVVIVILSVATEKLVKLIFSALYKGVEKR